MPGKLSILAVLSLALVTGCGRTPPTFVERAPLKGHSREVTSLAFSPDGKTLASRGADAVKVWNWANGVEVATDQSDGSDFGTVAFSPDGAWLATEQIGHGLIARSRTSPGVAIEYPFAMEATGESRGWGLAFSPDGKLLVGGGSHGAENGFLAVWDRSDQKVSELAPLKRPITTVAFAPDGRTIASGSMDGKLVLWDRETRKERLSLSANRSFLAPVVFSPDGRLVASANEARDVRLWDVRTGRDVGTLKGHLKAIFSLAFHPHGRTLISGDSGGTLFVWDVPSRRMLTRLEPSDRGKVWSLAFSPDGKILASGGEDRLIHLWDQSGD